MLRRLIVFAVVIAIASLVMASAANLSVGSSSVGSGSNVVGGYTASNVVWEVDASIGSPMPAINVQFDLAPSDSGTEAYVKLGATDPWAGCAHLDPDTFKCTLDAGPDVATISALYIAAAN